MKAVLIIQEGSKQYSSLHLLKHSNLNLIKKFINFRIHNKSLIIIILISFNLFQIFKMILINHKKLNRKAQVKLNFILKSRILPFDSIHNQIQVLTMRMMKSFNRLSSIQMRIEDKQHFQETI